jgi:hypothetical protein
MGRLVLPNYPHHVVQRGHIRQVVLPLTKITSDTWLICVS